MDEEKDRRHGDGAERREGPGAIAAVRQLRDVTELDGDSWRWSASWRRRPAAAAEGPRRPRRR